MKNDNYFSTLLSLYEAVSTDKAAQQQANIADTGSDVQDPNVDPNAVNAQEVAQDMNQEQPQQQTAPVEQIPEEAANEEDPEGLDDASYMSSTSDVTPQAPSDTYNSKKLARLFDLMQNLSLYAETFKDTLETVELGLLDDSDMRDVEKYRTALDDLSTKIKDYLNDVFIGDTYEKALYAYVMFRTELLVAIKQLRKLLKLNEVDEKDDLK